jgi:capsule polysaccharide export protein KpsE/RkpR
MPHRTLADLEAAVQKLDQKVATGQMKIVDERKAVQEINLLNRRKKDFAVVEEMQNSIDADRTKLKAMKDQKQDPELKELNDRYDALDKEFKEIKAEQDSVYSPSPSPSPQSGAVTDRCTKLQKPQFSPRRAYPSPSPSAGEVGSH